MSRTVIDPITFEVLRNAFMGACNEMAVTVAKTAYSSPINEGNDYATAVYSPDGKLVCQGESDLPAFIGLTMLTVPEVMRAIGVENMAPGDIYMINDPYIASTHCNDIHFVKPIFDGDELVAFTSCTAHWSDVGGVVAGSLNVHARSHFEEGVRIPALTLCKRGVMNNDIVAILLHNMRQSWERLGDLNAQVAAVRRGGARIESLVKRYGSQTVLDAMEETQNYSERMARASFRALPDGDYYAEDRVDEDVYTGEPKTVRLKLSISGDHAVFDLTESDGAAESAINCTIAATTSAVFIGLAAILPPMPVNSGVMRAIEIKAKRGSLVWAQPPVGISGLAITTMDITMGATTLALSEAYPERAIGLPSAVVNTNFAGDDTRPGFDGPFINYAWCYGGLGATRDHDGPNGCGSPYAASASMLPTELMERRYPVLFHRLQLLPDSGGPGRSRGGLAIDRTLEQHYQETTVSNITNRTRFGPAGIFGGSDGSLAQLLFSPGTEQERDIGTMITNVPVRSGEVLTFWANGGGGYSDALERPVERVVEDIKDDYITLAAARSQYGVVIREIDAQRLEYEADEAATAALRKEMRAARG